MALAAEAAAMERAKRYVGHYEILETLGQGVEGKYVVDEVRELSENGR